MTSQDLIKAMVSLRQTTHTEEQHDMLDRLAEHIDSEHELGFLAAYDQAVDAADAADAAAAELAGI